MTHKKTVDEEQLTSYLFSANAGYIEELYEKFLKDPSGVASEWRHYFSTLSRDQQDTSHAAMVSYFEQLAKQPASANYAVTSAETHADEQVMRLIEAYRAYGHFMAHLDPLDLSNQKQIIPHLKPSTYGLDSLDASFSMKGLWGLQTASLKQIIAAAQKIYCSTIGFQYKHLTDQEEQAWLRDKIEAVSGKPVFSAEIKKRILQRLVQAEGLEKYLGSKYVAQKRFSLEGGDSLIPLIDQLIQEASSNAVKEIAIGIAHRGRLNMLINILGKPPQELFDEFEGQYDLKKGSGDVKYHKGFSSVIKVADAETIRLTLGCNPSHLESIDPVVEGFVRERQDHVFDGDRSRVLPLLIHGDASFAGQGVVMETFNFSQTENFTTGGTLHIVINNQVGFTTDPSHARSTQYCTDVAKMVEAPVFHVNADDPEAVLFVAQLAINFRLKFKKDVVIDLVCYRRHGHNEADEPAATQPVMYKKIKQLPTVLQQYTQQLIAQAVVTQQEVDAWLEDYKKHLDACRPVVQTCQDSTNAYETSWEDYRDQSWTAPAKTGVAIKTLKQLAKKLEALPESLALQPQVAKIMADRQKMTDGTLPLNWGYAEALAYATLLAENYTVRLSGQDCGRGTFFHRHAVLHDYLTNETYVPLANIAKHKNAFTVVDSTLSEFGIVGFEYGYSLANPNALVIWEAQYGDFFNGAQIIIDQFISSSEQKWQSLSGLVLFLPHGYEGAGPEHSSGRLERFLQLCAQDNMQVCVPTTPAQIFHLLRRQLIRRYRKPLIVMTPKSLLRHKLAVSTLESLASGQFELVIPETDDISEGQVKQVVLCSGKIYYDLLEKRRSQKKSEVALIRVEQLYPFPKAVLAEKLLPYKKVRSVIWCQEEPKNQGAWHFIRDDLSSCLTEKQTLTYVGRKASAAPAVGSPLLHDIEQKKIIDDAFQIINS